LVGEIASIIAPVFIVAALGFAWARSGAAFDTNMLTGLVTLIGTPCLILDTFLRVRPDPQAFADLALSGLALYACFAVLGLLVLTALGWSYRDYLGALIFPNQGNMGLPLCLFAFGEEGLAFAIVYFSMGAILNFTVGSSLAAGRMDPKGLLRMPIIYAVAASVAITLTGWQPDDWLHNTLSLLGGITIPLMLLALGVSLARLKPSALWRGLLLSAVRLLGGFGIGLLVVWIFGLSGAQAGVTVIQATMPAAVFNYLFAERYGRAGPEVAGIVLLSTLISFASLPALLWFVLEA